ncbi:MAG: hypothetical protein ONB12_12360 [candidate division KSB1 bacterium]|nr:hypothetical protein [candidate division KSB1 bacterium]
MEKFLWFIPLWTAWTAVEFALRPIRQRLKGDVTEKIHYSLLHSIAAYGICFSFSLRPLLPLTALLNFGISFLPLKTWRQALLRYSAAVVSLFVLAFGYPIPAFVHYVGRSFATVLRTASWMIAVVIGAGDLVGLFMKEIAEKNCIQRQGIAEGGLWIGRLERLLILLFFLAHFPAGAGFLAAAKSILRFSETHDNQKAAAYVIIGTLASFAAAVSGAMIISVSKSFLGIQ